MSLDDVGLSWGMTYLEEEFVWGLTENYGWDIQLLHYESHESNGTLFLG